MTGTIHLSKVIEMKLYISLLPLENTKIVFGMVSMYLYRNKYSLLLCSKLGNVKRVHNGRAFLDSNVFIFWEAKRFVSLLYNKANCGQSWGEKYYKYASYESAYFFQETSQVTHCFYNCNKISVTFSNK